MFLSNSFPLKVNSYLRCELVTARISDQQSQQQSRPSIYGTGMYCWQWCLRHVCISQPWQVEGPARTFIEIHILFIYGVVRECMTKVSFS